MKILGVVRLSAGFGGIWVANGGHFGRLAGYFRFVLRLSTCSCSLDLSLSPICSTHRSNDGNSAEAVVRGDRLMSAFNDTCPFYPDPHSRTFPLPEPVCNSRNGSGIRCCKTARCRGPVIQLRRHFHYERQAECASCI